MKHQALSSSIDKSKKMLQFLFGALKVITKIRYMMT